MDKLESKQRDSTEPRARSCKHLGGRRFELHLENGAVLCFDADLLGDFPPHKDEAQLQDLWVAGGGEGIIWESLDYAIFVPGLVLAVTGSNAWSKRLLQLDSEAYGLERAARAMGQKGGAAQSPAKAAASRSNGAKGGRPKKAPKPKPERPV